MMLDAPVRVLLLLPASFPPSLPPSLLHLGSNGGSCKDIISGRGGVSLGKSGFVWAALDLRK